LNSNTEKILIDTSYLLADLLEGKTNFIKVEEADEPDESEEEDSSEMYRRATRQRRGIKGIPIVLIEEVLRRRRSNPAPFNMDELISLSMSYIAKAFDMKNISQLHKLDNLVLSVAAFALSRTGDKSANNLMNVLETKSSNNTEGTFWTSKWKSIDTCEGKYLEFKPSFAATSFAFSAYIKMKKEGTEDIAKWLVSSQFDEKYKSFVDTFEVARSLVAFGEYSESLYGKRPEVIKKSSEYLCPIRDTEGKINFTLKVIIDQ